MYGGSGVAGLDPLEEPGDGEAHEAKQAEPAEDVDKSPESGLLVESAVDQRLGWV